MLRKISITLAFAFALTSLGAAQRTEVIRLQFTSNELFTADLSDSSSQAFQFKANQIRRQLLPVFVTYPSFLQLVIILLSDSVDTGEGSGSGPRPAFPPIFTGREEDPFSFRVDPTEVNRPLVSTVDLVFNRSGIVPSTDEVVNTLREATVNGDVTIPIILSSVTATNVPPATTAPPATSGAPTAASCWPGVLCCWLKC
ncbi:hypothetical protein COCON_G00105960 [Conger conger]|uniref:Uncharacterized protein n=1 Tax=Conger conger TaxID=82655 RepID=A0A9Q1HZT1_CONCO|nr:hypothetical protein COCON_G00105960 [Conger conger]